MNKAYLIYNSFFDLKNNCPSIGGIQTYIIDLASTFKKNGYEVTIVQIGSDDSCINWNDYSILTLKSKLNDIKRNKKTISRFIEKEIKENDFLVFMTHTLNCKTSHKKTVSIQHGIYWDVPSHSPKSKPFIECVYRNFRTYNDIKNVNKCKYCVCVDYNFLNWYKTQQYYCRTNLNIIPNYAISYKRDNFLEEKVKILFARRFEQYRGTRIFADAAKRVLEKYPDVEITFAGTGPDENYLKHYFKDEKNVSFIKYSHDESYKVHLNHNVAVVASIGSEGTSLSLLEAMGCGCAAVTTNVGGCTNIVIDGFNGLISDTNSDSLFSCLDKLISNPTLREQISKKAFDTVNLGFSKEKWEQSWAELISKIDKYEEIKG